MKKQQIQTKTDFTSKQNQDFLIRDRLTSVRDIYDIHQKNFEDIISLAEGGCFFPTPLPVLQKIIKSSLNISDLPHQIYPVNNASSSFLDAIWNYFSNDCHISLDSNTDGILYGYGSSHLFDTFLSVVCKPDDHILMPESYYHAYVEWPEKWGGKAVRVPTKIENGYKITAYDLANWLKDNPDDAGKAKCIVITTPTSTGAIYTREEMLELSKIIRQYNLLVYSDEVYRDTIHPGKTPFSTAQIPELKPYTVTANSGSKSRSVANIRIGWACGPKHIIDKMIWNIEYSVIDVPLSLQAVGESILTDLPENFLKEAAQEYLDRLELILNLIEYSNKRINIHFNTENVLYLKAPYKPQAGYSICIDFESLRGSITEQGHILNNGQDLCRYFCNHKHIANDGSEKSHGVMLSSGFSKGHDNFIMYLVFGQAGYEHANSIQQPYIQKSSLEMLSGIVNTDQTLPDMGPAKQAGRQMLIEAFDRIVCAVKQLQISA